MVDSGDFAGAVDPGRRADGVLGPSDQQVALASDTAVQRRDRTSCDIGSPPPRSSGTPSSD